MPRRFPRRRIVIIAAIIVALSLGIVVASVPFLPHPHGTLKAAQTQNIQGASQNSPGAYGLQLAGLPNSNSFAVGVTVTNGNATLCVTQLNTFLNWQIQSQLNSGTPFPPFDSTCISVASTVGHTNVLYESTNNDIITFTPPTSGDWAVVALNYNPTPITVIFSPA